MNIIPTIDLPLSFQVNTFKKWNFKTYIKSIIKIQYINDCRSLRRRLLIVEKIIVIFLAVISFPVGFLIMSTFDNSVIQIVNNFTDSYNLFVFILISVLDFLALLTVLFATKSFSFYKGVPQNIVINIVLSFGVFLCCSAFTIKGAWVKSAICGATFFSVFSSLGVLIVQLINIFNQKVILILLSNIQNSWPVHI